MVRPLVFIEKKEIISFARTLDFPLEECRCPYADVSRRTMVQKLLRGLGKDASLVKHNIWRATRKWLEAYPPRPYRSQGKQTNRKVSKGLPPL